LGLQHEVLLIALTDEDVSPNHIEIVKTHVQDVKVLKISKIRRTISLLKSTFTDTPFQVAYYYDAKIDREIASIAKSFGPDHIYCQLTRMSEYARNLPYPKTLDYMDALGVGMERRAEVVSGVYASVFKKEARRLKLYEEEIYHSFDHHTIISEQDARQLTDKDIHIVPNGIDTDFFSPRKAVKKYDLGFVGNMGYPPNIDACEYLVRKILPLLDPKIKVILAGARPDRRVKQLASASVTVTGWMDDVRIAYAESGVFVAPLWLGTGQQNKILEAMAMGVPCVTSASVNNAIGAESGKEILIADNQEEFAEAINSLLNDPELYKSIRRNALTFVRHTYGWENSVEKLMQIMMKG
jgi:glycosyltransferase involved in cell wall biosynthesis